MHLEIDGHQCNNAAIQLITDVSVYGQVMVIAWCFAS